jgi:hypothetical protein
VVNATASEVARADCEGCIASTDEQVRLGVESATARQADPSQQVAPPYLSGQIMLTLLEVLPDGSELVVVSKYNCVEGALG